MSVFVTVLGVLHRDKETLLHLPIAIFLDTMLLVIPLTVYGYIRI